MHVPFHLRRVSGLPHFAVDEGLYVTVVEVPVCDEAWPEGAERVRALDPQHRTGVGVPEVMKPEVVGDGVSGDVVGGIALGDVEGGFADHDGYLALEVEVFAPLRPDYVSQMRVEGRRWLVEIGRRRWELGHEFVDPASIREVGGDDLRRLDGWQIGGGFGGDSLAVDRDQLPVFFHMNVVRLAVDEDASELGHCRSRYPGV